MPKVIIEIEMSIFSPSSIKPNDMKDATNIDAKKPLIIPEDLSGPKINELLLPEIISDKIKTKI
ncbi:MAG: hypothetical protein QXW79_05195 [Thermoplasmata archaeon]